VLDPCCMCVVALVRQRQAWLLSCLWTLSNMWVWAIQSSPRQGCSHAPHAVGLMGTGEVGPLWGAAAHQCGCLLALWQKNMECLCSSRPGAQP
jgi:hypothetical protein